MPILTYNKGKIEEIDLQDGDTVKVDFLEGSINNKRNDKTVQINPF